MKIHTISGVHCEQCGRVDPETIDGYTECCNEPTCWGGTTNVQTWAVGTFEPWPSIKSNVTGSERGCCAAAIKRDLPDDVHPLQLIER